MPTCGVAEACSPDGTAFGVERALAVVRCYRQDPAYQNFMEKARRPPGVQPRRARGPDGIRPPDRPR